MRDLFWGALIIGIGIVSGRSAFLGDFGWWNLLFDGLGSFWLVRGAIGLVKARAAGGPGTGSPAPADVPAGVAQTARKILDDMKRNYATPVTLRPVAARNFAHLDLRRYDALRAALEKRGFRCLGDFENTAVNESPSTLLAPTFVRASVSEEGTLVVGYYQTQPRMGRHLKLLLTGLLNLRWLAAPRNFAAQTRKHQCADVTTELDDGTFIVTSNAQSAALLSQPPAIRSDFHAFDTPLPVLLDRHRAELARTLHGGARRALQVRSDEDLLSMEKRMAAAKIAWRESVNWVTRDELRAMAGGNNDFADAVYEEVRRLVAAERAGG